MDYSRTGTWFTDSDDSSIRHIVEDCYDTDYGMVDAYGNTCQTYQDNPSMCDYDYYATETFNAMVLCCTCGGGSYYEYADNSSYGGMVYDEDDTWVATWYLNQTETEDGYWEDIY